MLKKMRWRFIRAAMVAFTVVVLALLFIVNIWNYGNITRQQDETLQLLMESEAEGKPPFGADFRPPAPGPFGQFSPEVQHMTRFFVVYSDTNHNALKVKHDYIASVSEDEAINYTKEILSNSENSGYYEGYRFLVERSEQGSATIFLNAEKELQSINSLLRITVAVALCCLCAVFILVVALSHRAIAPYIKNIETQKQFITDAGHELKTPLTAISTSADVLAMEVENNEWVQNIQLQSKRMSKLIGDLVTLSRLDEEHPFPDMSEFPLSEAVWEISEPFSAIAEASRKEYVQRIEDNLVLNGDKNAIQQMVSILLDNALKHSDDNGKIRLDVKKKQRKIEFVVYNTCHITDLENPNRLFDRFYRSESSRSNRDNYGIGLSIAKSIAENHGGTIRVEITDNTAIWFIVTI